MSSNRSIDILRVQKAKTQKTSPESISKSGDFALPKTKKLSFLSLIAGTWKLVFDSSAFQFSLLKSLLGLRGLLFAILPLIFFQLRFYSVLNSDQLLRKLNLVLSPSSTSSILIYFGLAVAAIMVSFLADTVISPSLVRYNFQKISNRKVKIYNSFQDSASISLGLTLQKIFKFIIFLIVLTVIILIYWIAYLVGGSSIVTLVGNFSIATLLMILVLSLYFAFKNWLLSGYSIGYKEDPGKIRLALKQIFRHPLGSLGYGFIWLFNLIIFIVLSVFLSVLVIRTIDSTGNLWLQIASLAIGTTITYVIWAIWNSWSASYWAIIIQNKAQREDLVLYRMTNKATWQMYSLFSVCILFVAGSFLFGLMYSNILISSLEGISKKIPDKLEFNLPKPQ